MTTSQLLILQSGTHTSLSNPGLLPHGETGPLTTKRLWDVERESVLLRVGSENLSKGPGQHPAPRATGQGPGPRGPPLSPAARQGPPWQESLHRRVTVAFSCPSFLLLAGQTEWEKRSAPTPASLAGPGRPGGPRRPPVLSCKQFIAKAFLLPLPRATASSLSGSSSHLM